MKFIHLADLHLGKRVNEFPMIEDQKYILIEILNIIDAQQPDAVIIAGDVYDKSFPAVEAVELLNFFINELAARRIETFIISGNHDSAERLAFASDLIAQSGIHIAGTYRGQEKAIEMQDKFGAVKVFMLPFIKPIHVRKVFEDKEIHSYDDALATAIEALHINTDERNVLITHQFVTGAKTCESEDISVGGSDNVDVSLFDDFDYVALGHIHSPQYIGRETVRYAGSPLKYSFSEASHQKSICVVEMGEKGEVDVKTLPLVPQYDMVAIKGTYNEIMSKSFCESLNREDYYHITLTDEEDVLDAINRLRTVYPKTMQIKYDNARTQAKAVISANESVEKMLPIDLLGELYEKQNGQPLSETQREYALAQIQKVWEDEA